MKKTPPRAWLLLVLLLALGCLTAWLLSRPEDAARVSQASRQPPPSPPHQSAAPPTTVVAPAVPATVVTPAPVPVASPPTTMQAYRLVVRDGQIALDGVAEIRGQFHPRRGPMSWQPGMWCIRFLDADLRVLAQETAAAPDQVCVVLDPHVLDQNGAPKASQLAGIGGAESMLQVRMSPMPSAKWIKVYQVAGAQQAELTVEPFGRLLASIPLP